MTAASAHDPRVRIVAASGDQGFMGREVERDEGRANRTGVYYLAFRNKEGWATRYAAKLARTQAAGRDVRDDALSCWPRSDTVHRTRCCRWLAPCASPLAKPSWPQRVKLPQTAWVSRAAVRRALASA
jgi:hypothetical protein